MDKIRFIIINNPYQSGQFQAVCENPDILCYGQNMKELTDNIDEAVAKYWSNNLAGQDLPEVILSSDKKSFQIEKAKHLEKFKLWVKFNNGFDFTVDLGNLIKGDNRFESISKMGQFSQFQIEKGVIVWNDDVDLAPEYLFDIGIIQEKEKLQKVG